MLNKKIVAWTGVFLWYCLISSVSYATSNDGLGQTIQIETHFRYLLGGGTFSIIVRDLDHQQNIPYVFDITQPNNFWLIFTQGRNYVITVSQLQMVRYKPCCNQYKPVKIGNFCHLESNGRIMRGKSMRVIITGDLTPFPYTYFCQTATFPDMDFTVVSQKVCSCHTETSTTTSC